eukprot:565265-Pelagomonas_calceolata.AAC.6
MDWNDGSGAAQRKRRLQQKAAGQGGGDLLCRANAQMKEVKQVQSSCCLQPMTFSMFGLRGTMVRLKCPSATRASVLMACDW